MANEELSRPEPITKVVYVTPEMLTMGGQIQNIIRGLIRRQRLARFVIDEAHCVSAWGHDVSASAENSLTSQFRSDCETRAGRTN